MKGIIKSGTGLKLQVEGLDHALFPVPPIRGPALEEAVSAVAIFEQPDLFFTILLLSRGIVRLEERTGGHCHPEPK